MDAQKWLAISVLVKATFANSVGLNGLKALQERKNKMWFVSPSFKDKEWLCEPYEKDGKMYVKVMGAKAPREIRVYDEWQASWPASARPRIERQPDRFLAFNYPKNYYSRVVGIESVEGREGFWKYEKLPEKNYDWAANLILSPLFGYIGRLGRPVIKELEPKFVSITEVQCENGFVRLVSDEWYKNELKRLEGMSYETD